MSLNKILRFRKLSAVARSAFQEKTANIIHSVFRSISV